MVCDPFEGWAWFDGPPPPADPGLADAVARCLAGQDGRRVMAFLHTLTTGRSLPPTAPDTALRHLEGQRALVLLLQSLAARGG